MRKKVRYGVLFAVILLAALGISGGIVVTGYAEQKASDPSDLDVIIISNEDYDSDRKGPVTFTHRKHALDYKVSCWECHHEYDEGKNLWSPWKETEKCSECHMPSEDMEEVMNLQKAYHINCKGCHEELAKAKKNTGPHRKCYGCHEKAK